MSVGRKYRGNMEKTVLDYIRGRLEGNDNVVPGRIMITHTDMPQEIVDKAYELVKSLHPFQEICITSAGSTIGSHCGPACIGVLFFKKTA
jgi:fatty acid-binding protein DegV